MVVGEKVVVGAEAVEVRVLRGREYYEGRAGCMCLSPRFRKTTGEEGGRNGRNRGKREKEIIMGPLAVVRNMTG